MRPAPSLAVVAARLGRLHRRQNSAIQAWPPRQRHHHRGQTTNHRHACELPIRMGVPPRRSSLASAHHALPSCPSPPPPPPPPPPSSPPPPPPPYRRRRRTTGAVSPCGTCVGSSGRFGHCRSGRERRGQSEGSDAARRRLRSRRGVWGAEFRGGSVPASLQLPHVTTAATHHHRTWNGAPSPTPTERNRTGIYMMDWWEKYFCNTVAVTVWAGTAYYGSKYMCVQGSCCGRRRRRRSPPTPLTADAAHPIPPPTWTAAEWR